MFMLKEKKLEFEKEFDQNLTWDEFFNIIEIKKKHSVKEMDGKK